MYQVFFDGLPIYDPRTEDLLIRDPDVHLAVGEAGEMSFIIDDDHPHAAQLTKLKGVLELQADGLPIFKGRIIRDTRDFELSREIEVEGLLACLNDSIIPPYSFPSDWETDPAYNEAAENGNVVEFFLGWLLEQHNSQVGPAQQIRLGTVTVADPNNYIARASEKHAVTMEAVRDKLVDLMGGYLLADYTGETTVLHYYAELPLTNTQVVEYGENLLDLTNELDATETFTAILPVGAEGLTLLELPDGEISPGYWKAGKIIYSAEAEENLGGVRVTRMEEWSDVTLAENLQRKALARLSGGGPLLTQKITVKAVDLGFDPEHGVGRFVVGRHVQIESRPHDFSAIYPLMELNPDLSNPGNTDIVLGATIKSSTDFAKAAMSNSRQQIGQQKVEINAQTAAMNKKIDEVDHSSQSVAEDMQTLKRTLSNCFDFKEDALQIRLKVRDLCGTVIGNGLAVTGDDQEPIDADTTMEHLILTAMNGPDPEQWFVFTVFGEGKTESSDREQIALPYNRRAPVYRRHFTAGAWSQWENEALRYWPVGSIYWAFNHTNPGDLFGGTWERLSNTFLLAATSSDSLGQTEGGPEVELGEKDSNTLPFTRVSAWRRTA